MTSEDDRGSQHPRTPEDEALGRLRAADPAAGAEPDLPAIRAAVAAATGVPLAGTAPAHPAPDAPDELAARRRSTRSDWLRVAAAVAAVAVVGTGGYLAAGAVGSGATTAGSALPAISLDGGARGSADSAAAPEAAAGSATGDMALGGRSSTFAPVYGGRTVFVGQGLSTEAGSATAYAFDASSVASADTAARVAAALGVTGTPQVQWGSWVVGPNDGSGPTVTLDGGGNLSFYDPTRDPWQCQSSSGGAVSGSSGSDVAPVPPADAVTSSGAAGSSGSTDVAVPEPAPMPVVTTLPTPADPSVCTPGTTPTGDPATSRAREALAAVGVDTAGTQVQVDDSNVKGEGNVGAAYVYVSFQQVIDGRLTGVGWNVTLVGDGVQSLNGTLAPLVTLGSYDVISPAQAVDRLNDPRFGASGGMYYPMDGRAYAAEGSGAVETVEPSDSAPTVPPVAEPGAAISWPVQTVTLVSAQLGLALTVQASGAQLLVPAYALTDTTGATWSVIAVADAQLDFGTGK